MRHCAHKSKREPRRVQKRKFALKYHLPLIAALADNCRALKPAVEPGNRRCCDHRDSGLEGFAVFAYRPRVAKQWAYVRGRRREKRVRYVSPSAAGLAAGPARTRQQGVRRLAHDTGAVEEEADRHASGGPAKGGRSG